ncbi:hypothetical protein N2152v2_007994 [Parachlorella kessleri]
MVPLLAIYPSPVDGELGPSTAVKHPVVKVAKPSRPIGQVALQRIAGPRNLIVTFSRNELLSCVFVLHGYFEALSAEEDLAELEARDPNYVPFPEEAMKAAARRGAFNACIDWVTQLVRSLLDSAAAQRLNPTLAGKLVKDLRASVQRKATMPFYYRGLRVVKTSLLCEATLYTADLIVAVAWEAFLALQRHTGPAGKRVVRLAKRAALHAVRCGTMLAAVSLANGLGSMSPFRRGAVMFLLAQACGFVINANMYPLIDRISGPPPGGAAGAAGAAAGSSDAAAAAIAGPAAARAAAAEALAGDRRAGPAAAAGQRVAPAAAGAQPFLLANAQMPQGAAGALAEAALQAGAALAAGGAAAAAGVADAALDDPPVGQGQQRQQQQGAGAGNDAGLQADEEPPAPEPQQRRRVVGGPRLPDRPVRRGGGVIAPPPQAPHTPLSREPRAPSPALDSSDDAELQAAAAAAAAAGTARLGAGAGAGAGPSPSGDARNAPKTYAEVAAAAAGAGDPSSSSAEQLDGGDGLQEVGGAAQQQADMRSLENGAELSLQQQDQ